MDAFQEVENLLAQIRAVSASPAVERASDRLSVLCSAYMASPLEDKWSAIGHFTEMEVRILNRLFQRPGAHVSRDSLLNAMYYDKDDLGATSRCLDVFLTKIRRKLEGTPYSIPVCRHYRMGYVGLISEPSAAALTQLKAA